MNMDAETPTIGHNQPPLPERMKFAHPEIFSRMADLENVADALPPKFADDQQAGRAQDVIKAIRVALKQADATRDAEKEPFADAVKVINATFKVPMEALGKKRDAILQRLDAYLEEKKEVERLAREAEAERQREAADAALKAAQEAEARQAAARKAREDEEARAAAAAAEADRQRQEAKAAEARAAAAKAEAAKLEIERAAAAARQKEQDETAAKKRADEEAASALRLAELKEQRATAEREALAARAAADKAIIEKVTAEADAREAKADERTAAKEQNASLGQAVRADKRADRMDERAQASDAELSRTRGELGTVGSLARRWTSRIIDYDKLPLEPLRHLILRDALDAAVHRAMINGVREMPGVVFEEISSARVA